MFRRLMTPRPICNEDGRDVRGRRGGKAEARRKRGVAAGRLLVGLISCGKNKRYNMKSASLASFILATTNGDEGHSFYQGPRV
ncbi:hypothetical protein NDU88_003328 [Pleurodeles waltl]|uniref:Uncharacterized protein n=2 Tax=Pleurodeles waltl TaxID=8319 RepID=A0AAV7SFF1_PLEWA|nr:hypothetical protein NDU88_003328 [Pleurodeles waltl]